MKMFTALLFTLVAGLSTTAAAEPFNERGDDWTAGVSSSVQARREAAIAAPNTFNQRGEHYRVTAPSGSNKPRPVVEVSSKGFNARDTYSGG